MPWVLTLSLSSQVPENCFNPCSGGSIALGPLKICHRGQQASVSILVLVEVLPWGTPFFCSRGLSTCFNPCSGGSIALGAVLTTRTDCGTSVSILVLVEVLPWAHWQAFRVNRVHWVSILVLVEVLPWEPRRPRLLQVAKVSILVLVEVLPWVGCAWARECSSASFNPCSGGSIALGNARRPCTRRRRFGFNPCSGGSIALGRDKPSCLATSPSVSILVLVEVLPWASTTQP